MKIKICPADKYFSQWIRLRDKQCVRCHSKVEFNEQGLPISHQASHFWGRGKESTRFEPDNVDTLCMACHMKWGGDDREEYKAFKIKQLGLQRYKSLDVQAHTLCKKDREMQKIKWKLALNETNNRNKN